MNKTKAIRAARAFEFYVKRVWPLHRKLAGSKLSRRCRRCAASEKMVPLDDDGVCELCLQPTPDATQASAETDARDAALLGDILKRAQGAGAGQYDALLLYSGGKDSSYLARRIQEEFPRLRMLAMTTDNGFMSPVAKENIEFLVPKLGMDHLFIRPRKDFYRKLFAYALTHLNAEGGYGTADFSDGEFTLDTARNLAAEKSIPLILCGYSRYQVQNGLKLNDFEYPREAMRADRTETAGMPLKDIFDQDEMALWWHGSRWPEERIPRLLFPLYGWNLEESEILDKVKAWGLVVPKSHSPIVTNHQLIPLIGVVDVHRFGYSSFEKEFCRMIREGKADAQHWRHVFEFLEYAAKTGMFVKAATLDSLEQLGLTPQEVGIRFEGLRVCP